MAHQFFYVIQSYGKIILRTVWLEIWLRRWRRIELIWTKLWNSYLLRSEKIINLIPTLVTYYQLIDLLFKMCHCVSLSVAEKFEYQLMFHNSSSIHANSVVASANIWTLRKSFPPDGRRSCLRFIWRASDDIQRSERVRPVFQLENRTGIQRPKCKTDYISWMERKLFEFHWISFGYFFPLLNHVET